MKKYQYHTKYQKELLVAQRLDKALIKRLFSYLLTYKKWLILGLFLLIGAKGIEAYVPIYIGRLTQSILSSFRGSEEMKSILFQGVVSGSILMMCFVLFGYLMDSANAIMKSKVGQQAIFNLRSQVYQHILEMPIDFYNRNAIGRLMTRTIHDIDQIDLMFTDSVLPLLGNLLLFGCMAIGMIYIDWRVAVLVLFILPFVCAVIYVFRTNQRRVYEQIRAIVSALNTFVQEQLTGIMTIRNFGLEKKERKRFEEINEDHCNAYMESVKHFGFFLASIDFFSSFTLIAIFVVLVIYAPISSGFQAGTYFMFSLYTMMLFRPLIDLAERYNVLQSAFAASERVFDILDEQNENPGALPGDELPEVESIEFKNVWFAYENKHWVLKGISFKVRKGEALGIVGMTGSGKSTIMNLLLRLYDFQKGSILINGKDIREYAVKTIRKQFGVIFQDPFLFSGSLADNISLYDPKITRDLIEEAVDFVNLRSVVARYSKGIDHHLSERGKSLSMGEMQLVSLARTLVHQRSTLIFDEATANIDIETEKKIQIALNRILKIKTALVIAHRLSTIKEMSRIIVLHKGEIVESGTHQELLNANGTYEKLYRLQYTNF